MPPPLCWNKKKIFAAAPAAQRCPGCTNQLHSSSAVRDLKCQTSAATRWLSWASQNREQGQKMSGWEGTWWKKKGGKRLKKKRGKKADKDWLLPPVLLSSWPKAHPEPAATDDITVWDTTGRGRGLWLLFVTLATGPLVLGASVRASQCCAVIASPLSLSLPPILFYFLSLAFSFPAPLGAFWKSWFFFSILCYFFFANVLTN